MGDDDLLFRFWSVDDSLPPGDGGPLFHFLDGGGQPSDVDDLLFLFDRDSLSWSSLQAAISTQWLL
jgi:hypothetical protein